MRRTLAITTVIALAAIATAVGARATDQASGFGPALARDAAADLGLLHDRIVPVAAAVGLSATADSNAIDVLSSSTVFDRPAEVVTEAASPQAVAAPAAPAPTAPPAPARTAAPVVVPARPAATAAPAPTAAVPPTCPATWFCYPRLGVSGPIVPYTDCSGSTDVGTSIRSYNCLSDHYLMGHAYTQFGLVRQWVAGDVVFAWGQRFTVTGAITQQSCGSPSFPLAPLSMQTSLTSSSCGAVLVVQAR